MNKQSHGNLSIFLLGLWLAAAFQSAWAESNDLNGLIVMTESRTDNIMPPAETLIYGGQRVDPSDFPWTLKFNYLDSNRTPRLCTATVVGDRVVFVAAHCGGTDFSIELAGHNQPFKLTCTRNPKFDSWSLHGDLMICLSDSKFPTTRKFERISISEVKEGNVLFLLGYGCRDLVNKSGTIGTLMGGTAAVIKSVDTGHVYTKGKELDVPSTAGKDVMVCPGDSGGAAYLAGNKITGKRSIIGVVSAFIEKKRESLITPLFLSENKAFIDEWRLDNPGVLICGKDQDAKNCR
jgi:hypothetical protein